jgi:DNA-binding response OmpR family regulator
MESVLLVFDDARELDFIGENLAENGFKVLRSVNLNDAFMLAEKTIPNLIVVNTVDSELDFHAFSKKIKIETLKDVTLLSLIELEAYMKTSNTEHIVVKPVRPKLLLSLIRSVMNNEEINWLTCYH